MWNRFVQKNYGRISKTIKRKGETRHVTIMRKLATLYRQKQKKKIISHAPESNQEPVYEYYDNGKIKEEVWHDEYGQIHRDGDEPAYIQYYENGKIQSMGWYKNDDLSRENDRPAFIEYHDDGSKKREKWIVNGEHHRDNFMPSVIKYYPNGNFKKQKWHIRGKLESSYDQPAVIIYYDNGDTNYEYWYENNRKHRDNDEPAEKGYYRSGNLQYDHWYQRGKIHRENDKPAIINYYDNEEKIVAIEYWYLNELNTRIDVRKPSVIYYDVNGNVTRRIWKDRAGRVVRDDVPSGTSETCDGKRKSKPVGTGNEKCNIAFAEVEGFDISEIKKHCIENEVPKDSKYIASVREMIEAEFPADDDKETRRISQGEEFKDSMSYDLTRKMSNLSVIYKNETGIDAGGLRRQYVDNLVKSITYFFTTPENNGRSSIDYNLSIDDIKTKFNLEPGVTLYDVYFTVGKILSFLLVNGIGAPIPFDRFLIDQLLNGNTEYFFSLYENDSIEDMDRNAFLNGYMEESKLIYYYIMDNDLTSLRTMETAELREYLIENAKEKYFNIGGNEALVTRLEGLMDGFRDSQTFSVMFDSFYLSNTELYDMLFISKITSDDFRMFLETRVSFKDSRSSMVYNMKKEDKVKLIEKFLMPLGENSYSQFLKWISGSSQILPEPHTYVIMIVPNLGRSVASHTCFNTMDIGSEFIEFSDLDFLKAVIYNEEFTTH